MFVHDVCCSGYLYICVNSIVPFMVRMYRKVFYLKVGSINSLCQIFDLSLSAECQFLRERCGHRDR